MRFSELFRYLVKVLPCGLGSWQMPDLKASWFGNRVPSSSLLLISRLKVRFLPRSTNLEQPLKTYILWTLAESAGEALGTRKRRSEACLSLLTDNELLGSRPQRALGR